MSTFLEVQRSARIKTTIIESTYCLTACFVDSADSMIANDYWLKRYPGMPFLFLG